MSLRGDLVAHGAERAGCTGMVRNMTKHRHVLDQVMEMLQRDDPECGVLLTGSVLRGTEHAESDIDLFAAVPDINGFTGAFGEVVHATAQVRVIQACLDGISVTLTCCDSGLLDEMVRTPWRNYLFAKAAILRDPLGLIEKTQQAINEWFAANPAVEAIWIEQQRKHGECKSAICQGDNASLEFPSWDAFADHVDNLVRQGTLPDSQANSSTPQ